MTTIPLPALLLAATAPLLAACGGEPPPSGPPAVGPPAAGAAFEEAVARFAAASGAPAKEDPDLPGCRRFEVPLARAEKELERWTREYLARGVYLFRREMNFGLGGAPEVLVMMPTTDKYEVLRRVDVNGVNYDLDNAAVLARLREMEEEDPFLLTGANFEYCEGVFLSAPRDPLGLAKRIREFCPDVVEQGTGTVEALAEELRARRLYLWWD